MKRKIINRPLEFDLIDYQYGIYMYIKGEITRYELDIIRENLSDEANKLLDEHYRDVNR
jgi:hypothetical protein